MKTKTLLLFASLVVLATFAHAAQYPTENETVVLPTYTVTTPHYPAVVRQINASLDELRQQAKAPVVMPVDCDALKAVAAQGALVSRQAPDEKAGRLAKL